MLGFIGFQTSQQIREKFIDVTAKISQPLKFLSHSRRWMLGSINTFKGSLSAPYSPPFITNNASRTNHTPVTCCSIQYRTFLISFGLWHGGRWTVPSNAKHSWQLINRSVPWLAAWTQSRIKKWLPEASVYSSAHVDSFLKNLEHLAFIWHTITRHIKRLFVWVFWIWKSLWYRVRNPHPNRVSVILERVCSVAPYRYLFIF